MRIGLRFFLLAGFLAATLQFNARGADAPKFKDDKDKASYGAGVFFGTQLKNGNLDLDLDTVLSAMKDILEGREPKLSRQEAQQAIMAYQHEMQLKLAEKNRAAGDAFLAANKTKAGVKTQTVTLADGKTAEFQYKVLAEGSGESPKSNEVVTVNYRGTLIDGKEFDSSKPGAPLKRAANQLIRGWTEALEMMKPGAKWELYLPSSLAYGDAGTRGIEPGSMLIFNVELVSAEAPAPPPAPREPLTSDIIKVPSAEELKKGAKIEVIKAEDVAKEIQKQTSNVAKPATK